MRLTVAVVALVLVLAGCNALPTGGNDRPETATLTPVEVPDAEPVRTATPTPTDCLAPRVAPAERTPEPTPATPVPLPTENGTVDGSALVARHAAALENRSFAARIGPTRIESMPGATAFTYEGVSLGFESVRVFAVAGTIYRLHETEAGVSVSQQPYRPDSPETDWYLDALTGRDWLAERLGRLDYRRVDTRTWNGTEVRVFNDTFDGEALVGAGETLSIDSTVFVDRRGVVRYVRHVRTVRSDEGDEIVATTDIETFSVPAVGSVTVTRPDAFCVPSADVVAVSTPASATANATAGPFTAIRDPTDSGTAGESATVTRDSPAATVDPSTATASGFALTMEEPPEGTDLSGPSNATG
ncbi:hypothetical protein [Halosimplex amylolyticum]|uniref:hypothetical protein n=1 Tax=Halosimplex amylolyticum TaxID=3396616 RepID=UPI003F55383A